ncbi:MAG: helix-turn-helix domain-containing protein [Ruminococcus sp.]|nr:helix-turn-helix domain-containing protein [Ruminococcus sp.]
MYEIIKQLCDENNITISKLCEMVTNSTGNLATWKKNYMRSDYFQKIADYFQVSTDYLLGRTQEQKSANIKTGDNKGYNNNSSVNINSQPYKYDKTTIQVADVFQDLDIWDKAKVLSLIAELSKKNEK